MLGLYKALLSMLSCVQTVYKRLEAIVKTSLIAVACGQPHGDLC